jgi:hypothetical protein
VLPRQSERAAKGDCMTNLPANLRKLLEWLDRVAPLLEAQIVAAGLNHTLDKALMRNFAEMNLCEGTVSITARGRDALRKFPVVRPGPIESESFSERRGRERPSEFSNGDDPIVLAKNESHRATIRTRTSPSPDRTAPTRKSERGSTCNACRRMRPHGP